jgi:hypothetical protein
MISRAHTRGASKQHMLLLLLARMQHLHSLHWLVMAALWLTLLQRLLSLQLHGAVCRVTLPLMLPPAVPSRESRAVSKTAAHWRLQRH